MLWIVRTRHAEAVQLPGPHIGQKRMPDLVSLFCHRNTNVFFGVLGIIEKAKLHTRRVLGKNSEVDAVAHPCRTQRIWVTEEGSYRSHKRAAHLSSIDWSLAIMND